MEDMRGDISAVMALAEADSSEWVQATYEIVKDFPSQIVLRSSVSEGTTHAAALCKDAATRIFDAGKSFLALHSYASATRDPYIPHSPKRSFIFEHINCRRDARGRSKNITFQSSKAPEACGDCGGHLQKVDIAVRM